MAESGPVGSGRIFISYRREETAYPAGWLYDRLVDRFGADQVFKDVDSIQLGDDFAEVIATAVGSCDVLVALIGDSWASIADEHGNRRLDDRDDLVRLEIEAALSRQVRVIPILVDGARMPHADELPESLARLVRRQALELSPSRFDTDLDRLVRVVDGTLADVASTSSGAPARSGGGAPGGPGTPVAAVAGAPPAASEGPAFSGATAGAPPSSDRADERGAAPDPGGSGQGSGPASPSAGEAPSPGARRSGSGRWLALAAVGAAVLALLVVGAIALLADDDDESSDGGGEQATGASGAVEVDTRPDTTPEGITLSDLDYESRNDPPLVGDTATVTYTLTNDSDAEIALGFTFVGARTPDDDNVDAEDENEGAVLQPGRSIQASGRVILDSAGTWRLWPCFELADGTQCPDRWRVMFVPVSEP